MDMDVNATVLIKHTYIIIHNPEDKFDGGVDEFDVTILMTSRFFDV